MISAYSVKNPLGASIIAIDSATRQVTISPAGDKNNIGVYKVDVSISDGRTPPKVSTYNFKVTITLLPNLNAPTINQPEDITLF